MLQLLTLSAKQGEGDKTDRLPGHPDAEEELPAGELGDGGGGSVGGDAFATVFRGVEEISALDEERGILQRPGGGDFQERGVGDRHPGNLAPKPVPDGIDGKRLDGFEPKRSFDLDHLRLLF